MRIALFDYVVAPHSGPGSRDVELLQALGDDHQVTVFASKLVMPDGCSRAITHVSLPTIRRPGLASFLTYFVGACMSYGRIRLREGRFDVVQATDCSFPAADICYAHFCHRAYLKEVWPRVRGTITLRTVHSWASHATRALIEARLVREARVIVTCSEGLKRDFARIYPAAAQKVTVIHNTVDLAHFQQPSGFDRRGFRERMDTDDTHTAFVFVTLGHFERKGLPLLLEALSTDRSRLDHARLWVVGGEPGVLASYRAIAERLGIADKVTFAGRTGDVRPFLWSADAFVSPSHYEAFSAALLESAAAGLPLIATRISGSEELLEDGVNGLEIELSAAGVAAGLRRFLELDTARREAMRRAARTSVEPLGPERFAQAWRALYTSLTGERPRLRSHPSR
jgi:glycosyltransferase involved in cell wall biosynthesis